MSNEVNPYVQIPARWRDHLDRSRALLRESQDPSGAWPASPGFAPYQFSWFRDGCFIAEGADAAGLHAEARRFHDWCANVLRREEAAVLRVVEALAAGQSPDDSSYLPARYRLDGTRQIDDWWNFQVDGYGTWLWGLERHLRRSGASVAPFADSIEIAVRYLLATGRGTCRDWWEENREQTHVTTLAGVAAGLEAAVRMNTLDDELAAAAQQGAEHARADIVRGGILDGHLVKWLGDTEVDASLVAVAALYDAFTIDHPVVKETIAEVESRLVDGGVHRYEADTFYGGGQWPVLASLLAWHHSRAGDLERARELLDWVVSTADEQGLMPEQVPPMLAPDRLKEWEERWGSCAHPLLWSHGMFLAAVDVYASVYLGQREAAAPAPEVR
ncbi:MAG TPA: glycoside hydrolase family 15 protein [Nocardioidaceae bacterium]|nr:glycoside hydrolase family 15 protein [Nocardioidaceae bacterium]